MLKKARLIMTLFILLTSQFTSTRGEKCQSVTCPEYHNQVAYCCSVGCCYYRTWWKNWYFWVFGGSLVVFLTVICLRICAKINKRASQPPETLQENGAAPPGDSPPGYDRASEKELPEKYRRILFEYGFVEPRYKPVETRTNTQTRAHEYGTSAH